MIRHSALLLALLLAAILLWAPLPFGGVTPWAGALLAALCFGALALAAVAAEHPRALLPAAAPAAALAALALLGLLQAAPLPAGLVAALSPGHAELERQAAALGEPAVSRAAAPARLTLAASSTRRAALGWAAAAAAFLAAAVAGQRRELPAVAGRGGARRRPLPGLLRRPRLVRPRADAVGGGAPPPPCACAAPSSTPTTWRPTWRWRCRSPSPGAGGRSAARGTRCGWSGGSSSWRRRRCSG